MPTRTLALLRERVPRALPYLMYGLTEAFRSTYLPPSEIDRRPTSIGKAIPNAEVMVVRPDGTDMMHFLRCNENHHSIAVAMGPHHSLHHLSFEMRGIEEWMRGAGKILAVSAETSAGTVFSEKLMPERTADILETPLSGEGRAFRLRLGNEGGSRFIVEGGVELLLDAQRRVL